MCLPLGSLTCAKPRQKEREALVFARVYITERDINISQMKVNLMESLLNKVIKREQGS